jgi:hypothetical protein
MLVGIQPSEPILNGVGHSKALRFVLYQFRYVHELRPPVKIRCQAYLIDMDLGFSYN